MGRGLRGNADGVQELGLDLDGQLPRTQASQPYNLELNLPQPQSSEEDPEGQTRPQPSQLLALGL